ncbi:MAG: zinc ribbon domain-containing protein [Lachnospiraceae bacterium]|nr:zinc ribbon domain-containing protein [Lachnospiraceae bacterium]
MFCTNCGKEIPQGVAFCPACGQAVTESAQQATTQPGAQTWQSAPSQKNKLPLILAGCAAAVLLLIVAAVLLLKGGFPGRAKADTLPAGYVARQDMLSRVNSDDETMLFGFHSGIVTLDGGEPASYVSMATSLDNTKAALITGEDMILYYVADGEATEIDDDVYGVWMSIDGSALAYCKGNSRFYEGGPLFLWHPGDEKGTSVSDDCIGEAVFSANGAYLLFCEMTGEEEYVLTLYDVKNGEWEEFTDSSRELVAVSVTDDASMIVYGESGDSYSDPTDLYRTDGKKDTYLGQVFGMLPSFWVCFNKDCTEMIFYDLEEEVWYHMDRTGQLTELSGADSFMPISPATTASVAQDLTRGTRFIYGIPTFAGTFYREEYSDSDYTVYRFDKEFRSERFLRHVNLPSLSPDAKTMLYRRDDGIYSISPDAKSESEERLIVALDEDEISSASYNLTNDITFYVDPDGVLFYMGKNGGEAVALTGRNGLDTYTFSSSAEFTFAYGYITGTDTLLFIEDGAAMRSISGGTPEELTEIEGDVYYIGGNSRMGLIVMTHLGSTDAFYVTTDGVTFTLVTDEADVHEIY